VRRKTARVVHALLLAAVPRGPVTPATRTTDPAPAAWGLPALGFQATPVSSVPETLYSTSVDGIRRTEYCACSVVLLLASLRALIPGVCREHPARKILLHL